MLTKGIKFGLMATKAAALSLALALPAAAQVIVVIADLPHAVKEMNDQTVAETMVAQGFTDVHILREGRTMTVSAMRDGMPAELVYDLDSGELTTINGQDITGMTEIELTGEPKGEDNAGTDDGTDPGTDDGTDENEDPETDGTGTDDTPGDSDGGADTGTDVGGSDDAGGDDAGAGEGEGEGDGTEGDSGDGETTGG